MKAIKFLAAAGAAALSMTTFSAPAQAQAEPLLGQMMFFGGNFCPRGWSSAEGQLIAISSNNALFSLFGTMYGGDGRTSFALPDLRGRAPINQGQGPLLPAYRQGDKGGSTEFTILPAQMPSHTHSGTIAASPATGDTNQPVRNSFAAAPAGTNIYLDGDPAVNNMHPEILRIDAAGGGQPVQKVSPFLAARWCVATQGVFPSRS